MLVICGKATEQQGLPFGSLRDQDFVSVVSLFLSISLHLGTASPTMSVPRLNTLTLSTALAHPLRTCSLELPNLINEYMRQVYQSV